MDVTCVVAGCEKPRGRWSLVCYMHGSRMRRTGTYDDPPSRASTFRNLGITCEEYFWAHVEKQPDGCWLWLGRATPNGYGYLPSDRASTYAHRYSWLAIHGLEIPDGLQLDHLCRVKLCVNPAHMEPVTHRENTLRSDNPCAQNARKTHCLRGHEFTPENTWLDKYGHRHCRECQRIRARRRAPAEAACA